MIENYQIRIIRNEMMLIDDLYIFRRLPSGETEIVNYEKGEIICKTIKAGEFDSNVKPTFRIMRDLLPLLAEELKNIGVKPKDQSMIEGELEATKYHLEDMRKLLKLTSTKPTPSKNYEQKI